MTAPMWPRPYWRDSGAKALMHYFVFGDFAQELRVDAARYRTRGTPAGVEIARYAHDAIRSWNGYPFGGTLGAMFRAEDVTLFDRAGAARECLIVHGEHDDPSDLDALRDLVGTITALTELGGVAVVDPQMLSFWSTAGWRARFFGDDVFAIRNHVAILANEDVAARGKRRVVTRGMRKFARPDIDIRNVPADLVAHAGQLAERFAEFEALGGIIEDGREIAIEGLPARMHAHPAGSLDDAEFSNTHVAIRWPD